MWLESQMRGKWFHLEMRMSVRSSLHVPRVEHYCYAWKLRLLIYACRYLGRHQTKIWSSKGSLKVKGASFPKHGCRKFGCAIASLPSNPSSNHNPPEGNARSLAPIGAFIYQIQGCLFATISIIWKGYRLNLVCIPVELWRTLFYLSQSASRPGYRFKK